MPAQTFTYPRPRRASEPYRPIAQAPSRSGKSTITISEAHTVRHSQWYVSITETATGVGQGSRAFAALVGPGGAREWANEQWAVL